MTPSMDSITVLWTLALSTPEQRAIPVTGKGIHVRGDLRALLIGVTGHDGGDRSRERTAFIRIIRQAVAHAQRTEIRKAKPERAEDMGILGDLLGRITRVVHQNFLRSDENTHRRLETGDVELAVLRLELHQVQRGQIARGIVDEHIFAAVGLVEWIGSVPLQVCHFWIAPSYWTPGSPQIQVLFRRSC